MTAPLPTQQLVRAAQFVITRGECTIRQLRRRLRVTEAAAVKLTADLEAWGIVGPPRNAGGRIVRYSPNHLLCIFEQLQLHGSVPPNPNPLAELALPALTYKQRETLELVAEGCTDREISQKLYIAPDSVGSRMTAILRVLGARNRAHAVALGHFYGLLTRGVENRPIPTLTPQQLRLIELVAEGRTNVGVATDLSTSESVVKDLLVETREIFGARNRTHLVHLAVQRGVLTKNPEHDGGGDA